MDIRGWTGEELQKKSENYLDKDSKEEWTKIFHNKVFIKYFFILRVVFTSTQKNPPNIL